MDYETRKHFEAALADIAKLYGVKRDNIRESFKWFLIREGYIKDSTNELKTEELQKMADMLSKFYGRMNNTPPERRGVIDFKQILKS